MERNTSNRRDWRDSVLTKILAFSLVGLVSLGSLKLTEYYDKKFDEQYEGLKNQSTEIQVEIANKVFDQYHLSEGLRSYHTKRFLDRVNK